MSNIFINYRRGDDPGFTQALYGRLEAAFSPDRLFMDVDNIAPGIDFVQALSEQVAQCDVLIAVIGQGWLSAADETGQRRLDNPDDFVRIEIESALAQKKRVIPVLVNDAKMPRAADLPGSLAPLARCNAVRLTHDRFRADTQGLIKSLEHVLQETERERMRQEEERAWKLQERAVKERKRRVAFSQETVVEERPREAKARADTSTAVAAESSQHVAGGIKGRIATLPSELNWHVPLALIVIYVFGWLVPGLVFTSGGFGWGAGSLAYGLAGLVAAGAGLYVWRRKFGGPDLALVWFGVLSFLALIGLSVQMWFGLNLNPDVWMLWVAVPVAAWFVWLRRGTISGLEASVYWAGLVLLFFWSTINSVAGITAVAELDASLFGGGNGYRAAGMILAAVYAAATLGILAWRRSKLSRQELAVYGLALAYLLITSTLLWLECTGAAC